MATVESLLAICRVGVLEDGLSPNGVPRSTAPGGISNPEKKTSCGTQCSNPQSLSSGTLTQKHNGLRTTEQDPTPTPTPTLRAARFS
ncbi:Brain and acute leukemia cytoplasmic protein [Myotis davidii]|uniref:Brain and acute leukemia cytoplasmic protein n=1 Tax=Myotis davidii TaxID=225400 RepID=L5M3F6_MYODS|nr:Brain and acute leukemia cytoplasmic protein [Myotis davidii]